MNKFNFNHGTLTIDGNDITFVLPSKYINDGITETDKQKLNSLGAIAFPCTVTMDGSNLIMDFQEETNGYRTFDTLQKTGSLKQRLQFAEDLVEIGDIFEKQKEEIVTVFEPQNFLIDPHGGIKLIYRGIRGKMPAQGFDDESIFVQIQRLILVALSKANFKRTLYGGNDEVKQNLIAEYKKIVSKIINCKSIDELRKAVFEELQALDKKVEAAQKEKEESSHAPIPFLNGVGKSQKTGSSKGQSSVSTGIGLSKPVAIGALVAFIALSGGAYALGKSQAKEVSAPQVQQEQKQPEVSPVMLKGLRLASIQKYEEAAKEFDKVNYKKVKNKYDKKAILYSYLLSGQYEKVLEMEPEFAETTIAYLIANGKEDKIKELKSDEPSVKFEIAYVNKDYKQVIALKDKVHLDLRRQRMILDSYLKTKDYEGGLKFAQQTSNTEWIRFFQSKVKQ
jgi:WXG100 protein secretion system (Wss), protein YukC